MTKPEDTMPVVAWMSPAGKWLRLKRTAISSSALVRQSDALKAIEAVLQERDELREALWNLLEGRAGARNGARAAIAKATKEHSA